MVSRFSFSLLSKLILLQKGGSTEVYIPLEEEFSIPFLCLEIFLLLGLGRLIHVSFNNNKFFEMTASGKKLSDLFYDLSIQTKYELLSKH